jgi:sec-independent protein translocase protein TatC
VANIGAERKSFLKKLAKRGKNTAPVHSEAEMSFIEHLEALRWHLVRGVVVWLVATIVSFLYIDWVFDTIVYAPAKSDFITYIKLCEFSHWAGLGESLCMPPITIELLGSTISGPFMSAISIAMVSGVIIAFPYLFWELWRFVKPALSEKEKRYSRFSILWVSLCFFAGAAFGYYLLAPFTFNFLGNFTIGDKAAYKYLPGLDDYISTITNLVLGCGIAFELPILAYVLAKIGLISAKFLKTYRKYALVIILIVSAIITPSPDWTSQALVALPLILLYELSVILVSVVDKKRAKEVKAEEWS